MAGGDDLWRISDCVVYFGRRLLELVPPLCWAEEDRQSYAEAEAFWKHAKLVATAAETTAAYFRELDVNPEQAYIAGLLHNLKRLPHVLKFAGLRGRLCGTQDWVTDCDLPSFVNDVLETAHQGRISCGMRNLSRVVWFSRRWIGLCLPWSETCIARKNRFTLPLLQAANLINTAFPGTDTDPVMPFLETLVDSTMNNLEAERPASSSVLQPRSLEYNSPKLPERTRRQDGLGVRYFLSRHLEMTEGLETRSQIPLEAKFLRIRTSQVLTPFLRRSQRKLTALSSNFGSPQRVFSNLHKFSAVALARGVH